MHYTVIPMGTSKVNSSRRKLLKTVQTITTFRNPLADYKKTRRGPPLVRGPQFENRCFKAQVKSHC